MVRKFPFRQPSFTKYTFEIIFQQVISVYFKFRRFEFINNLKITTLKRQLVQSIICTVLLLLVQSFQSFAQQVISCSGNSGKSATAQLSYTIGETVVSTLTGSEAILTQGFQQGVIHLTAVESIELPGFEVSVFPNPATDIVKLKILKKEPGNYSFSIFDLSGKNLMNKNFTNSETEISLGFLIPSTYLMKIFDEKRELKTFKIVKTNN
jgi:hypothetical protein